METTDSLQISISCCQKKAVKNALLVCLKLDTCTVWFKIKNNAAVSFYTRKNSLSQVQLQHQTGGRAHGSIHPLLHNTQVVEILNLQNNLSA